MKEIKLKKTERRLVEEPRYEDVVIEKIVYETEDGHKFENKKNAEKHEEKLKMEKNMQKVCNNDTIFANENAEFYHLKTQEQLDWFLEDKDILSKYIDFSFDYGNKSYNRQFDIDKIKIPSWVSYSYYDGGDSRPDCFIIFNIDMKKEIEELKTLFD